MSKPQVKQHAKRRHQKALRKIRARRLLGKWRKHPERLSDHMADCSCHMCGNPRRHYGDITMSEKRIRDSQKHQENEVYQAASDEVA